MKLKVKKLNEQATLPKRAHRHDAGLDVTVIGGIGLGPQTGPVVLSTGIAVQIPEGWCGQLKPRSSLWKRGLMVEGLIDSGYRGEVKLIACNVGAHPILLEPGDRVAQLVLVPAAPCGCVWADTLTDSERGEGGLGSSE